MLREYDRKLILEDGSEYFGYGFGSGEDRVCEIVFNTSMVGYQEVMSDPSYTYQAVVMTYPLIGNYGMTEEDYETKVPSVGAMIVHEYNDSPSNFRSVSSLSEIMEKHQIPGISGVDTRKLTRSIRDLGSRKCLITGADTTLEKGLSILKETDIPRDAVAKVSCKKIWYSRTPGEKYHVAAIDCGMKMNIVRELKKRGCRVTVVPWNTPASVIEGLRPDGVFVSNGPGDPADVLEVIETIRQLRGKYPLFGICLGHQMIALAYGAKTYKMKFGHRGGNHPVRNVKTGKIEMTSQNHSYAVDGASVEKTGLTVTRVNLLDETVEGLESEKDRIFSVQYHPEGAPGPEDSVFLFDEFVALMEKSSQRR